MSRRNVSAVSKQNMRKYLSQIPFSSREPGPMRVLATEATVGYCITQSKILLSEDQPDYKIIIRLLTIAALKDQKDV